MRGEEENAFVTYRMDGGRDVMVWIIDGIRRDFREWVADSGVNVKTAGNRWRRLRLKKFMGDITEADLLDCLDCKRERPGPAAGQKKAAPAGREPFVYDLNHLLALGCPVAIRAEFARRLREGHA